MDTELVVQAQHGDEGAFASLAIAVGDRLHAVAHRILRDIDLAEDATQQALLSIWRDLPQLRDPARFEAWSYRLLVRSCYAEARRARQWSRTSACCRHSSRRMRTPSAQWSIATSSSAGSDTYRSTTARWSSCTTISTSPFPRLPTRSACRREPSDLDFITRCVGSARP